MTSSIRLQPLKRVRYSTSQVLGIDDFLTEQDYFREKLRRHNRLLHGWGVVTGMAVSAAGNKVTIEPGLALDPAGEEIMISEPVEATVPEPGGTLFVTIAYAEKETDPLPVFAAEGSPQNSRIEEGFTIGFQSDAPCENKVGDEMSCLIPLAKLVPAGRRRWKIDPRYQIPRVSPAGLRIPRKVKRSR